MTSGINKSHEKVVFAKDVLRGRVVRGSFEKNEFYSQKNVLVRDKNRKDRGIRKNSRRTGFIDNNRFYGINKSLEKVEFAKDVLRGRVVRGSFEKNEFYSRKNVLVRDKNRKDRGIRTAFRKTGRAPSLFDYHDETYIEDKPKQLIKK